MDKFIQWLIDKCYITDYGPYDGICSVCGDRLDISRDDVMDLPKQMLIGYMLEYAIERDGHIIIGLNQPESFDKVYDLISASISEGVSNG